MNIVCRNTDSESICYCMFKNAFFFICTFPHDLIFGTVNFVLEHWGKNVLRLVHNKRDYNLEVNSGLIRDSLQWQLAYETFYIKLGKKNSYGIHIHKTISIKLSLKCRIIALK